MSDQAIINEVLSLYQLKPTNESYAHYAQNAVFHDPVSIAEGLDSIKSQFNGMPKVFEKSETQKCETLTSNAQEIVLDLTQHYVFKAAMGKQPEKVLNSKVTLSLNKEGLIEKHTEEWDHQPNKDANDGFVGKMMEWRKKVDAKIVEKSVPSDASQV